MIHRELDAGGSGSCRINGRPATTALLRQIASLLIDIHGQRDSQELLSTEKHLSFVDGFGGLEGDLEAYQRVYRSLCQVREKRESLEMDESYKLQRQDLLQYQLNEIESASLTPGEEEELLAQREMIRNSERITGALGSGYQRGGRHRHRLRPGEPWRGVGHRLPICQRPGGVPEQGGGPAVRPGGAGLHPPGEPGGLQL